MYSWLYSGGIRRSRLIPSAAVSHSKRFVQVPESVKSNKRINRVIKISSKVMEGSLNFCVSYCVKSRDILTRIDITRLFIAALVFQASRIKIFNRVYVFFLSLHADV